MTNISSIEWTDRTSNIIRAINLKTGKRGHFCIKKSRGCAGCYAEAWNLRFGNRLAFTKANARKVQFIFDEKEARRLLKLEPGLQVFFANMTDLFQDGISDQLLDQTFDVLEQAKHLIIQILTKRIDRALHYLSQRWLNGRLTPAHIWIGASAENQKEYDQRRAHLEQIPAKIIFWSLEPLVGPIHLRLEQSQRKPDWIVTGGESGRKPQPSHPDWLRALHYQANMHCVPSLFKQWGSFKPAELADFQSRRKLHFILHDGTVIPESKFYGNEKLYPDFAAMVRTGKKKAGRQLDGRTWDEYPVHGGQSL
jgi:protein gp37